MLVIFGYTSTGSYKRSSLWHIKVVLQMSSILLLLSSHFDCCLGRCNESRDQPVPVFTFHMKIIRDSIINGTHEPRHNTRSKDSTTHEPTTTKKNKSLIENDHGIFLKTIYLILLTATTVILTIDIDSKNYRKV